MNEDCLSMDVGIEAPGVLSLSSIWKKVENELVLECGLAWDDNPQPVMTASHNSVRCECAD